MPIIYALLLSLTLSAATLANADDEAMIDLAWDSGCFNCHDLDKALRGPAWRDVAERYRGDDDAFGWLVEKVRNGGGGNWGGEAMSANRRVPEDDIRTLVQWILQLENP
jgi:cytochrome c